MLLMVQAIALGENCPCDVSSIVRWKFRPPGKITVAARYLTFGERVVCLDAFGNVSLDSSKLCTKLR